MVYSLLDDVSDAMVVSIEEDSPGVMYDHEVRVRAQQMRRRLDGRCKGLLEVVLDEPDAGLYFEYKVDFLHRTVRDFLLGSREIRRMLEQQRFAELSGVGYSGSDVWLVPCLSILEAFKHAPFRTGPLAAAADAELAMRLLDSLMMFVHEAEVNMSDRSALVRLLCDAEKTYDWRRWQFSWPLDINLFLGLACQADSFSYIEKRITPGWFTQPSDSVSSTAKFSRVEPTRTLLSYALEIKQQNRLGNSYDWTLHPRIVQHLLKMGADPKQPDKPQESSGLSVFRTFLTGISSRISLSKDEQVRKTLRLLLKHDVKLGAEIIILNRRSSPAGKLVEEILGGEIEKFQGEQTIELPGSEEESPRLQDKAAEPTILSWLSSWWSR